MSLKDLFKEKKFQYLAAVSQNDLTGNVESAEYIEFYIKNKDRFKPLVDYSNPANFARFGSAEKYYYDSVKKITQTYPYDGSKKEKILWEISSSQLDLYLFENGYPRTTGYATFTTSSLTATDTSEEYGAAGTASYEYVYVNGGPQKGTGNTIYLDPDTGEAKYRKGANIWDTSENRECNLKIGGTDGNTVEFWLKKAAFAPTATKKEVIFDTHTTSSISSSADYGRLRIEMSGHGVGTNTLSPFYVTFMSGTDGISNQNIGSSITTASIADDSWHHYAFRFKNTGSNVVTDLFIDGKHNHRVTTGTAINYVSGTIVGTIGALATQPSGSRAGAPQAAKGWGKLSGSVDEFRYWKIWRRSDQVQLRWFDQVGGGTNTDDANTDLGIYFKFNEGVTTTDSIDQTVLDYSGRVNNGTWTGYNALYSRNTGSAIDDSNLSTYTTTEFKDPILYSTHSDVSSFLTSQRSKGKEYDHANQSNLYYSLPSWLIEEHETSFPENEGVIANSLWNLTQILSSHFDDLTTQIRTLPRLAQTDYLSGSQKPIPFMDRILESKNFIVPEIFSALDALEAFEDRTTDKTYTEKVYDVKNIILQNIYNNLDYINKTKGTEKSFRNLVRCFGVDDDIYRFNLYGNNTEFVFRDNYRTVSERYKLINHNTKENSSATIYQYSSSLNTNSTTFISASENYDSLTSPESDLPFSVEANVIFPYRALQYADTSQMSYESEDIINSYPLVTTASLFGVHTAIGTDPVETTWASNDYANFVVKAVKPEKYTDKAYFVLTGTADGFIPELSSSEFSEVYSDKNWNFMVSLYPEKYLNADIIPGTSGSVKGGYTVEFAGVQSIVDTVISEFSVTGSMTADHATKFLASPKRFFAGSHRTNFTGTLITPTDAKMNNLRVWQNKLDIVDLRKHASDPNSYGIGNPAQNAYLLNSSINTTYVPNKETLLLHWNYDNVTGSDASGEFIVEDLTSGSATQINRYGWLSGLNKQQYLGKGYGFTASSTKVCIVDEIVTAKPQLPEVLGSDDMITVMENDDIYYTRESRPTFFDLYAEKSPYQSVSDDMMKFMQTVVDFNNIIGHPVHRYRHEYKPMNILRELFFQRIEDAPDVDKYIEYFKWFDIAVTAMIQKIAPMSSGLDERPLRTVIESHILERSKYQSKFPSYEFKQSDPQASLLGVTGMLYNWKYGHAPPSAAAQAIDALKITGGTVQHNDAFTVLVPENAGGLTGGVTVTVLARTSMGSTPSANQIHWHLTGTDANKIANLKLAINGTSDTSKVKFGSGVTSGTTVGIKGLTASDGVTTTDSFASLTADVAGSNGNNIAITDTVGTVLVNESALTGGKLAGGRGSIPSEISNENCFWWKDRALRDNSTISSGDADVDSDRNTILEIINNQNNAEAPNLSGSSGTYEGSTYAIRKFARPYKISVNVQKALHGGGNQYQNKKIGFWDAIRQRPTPSGESEGAIISIEPPGSSIEDFVDCNDPLELANLKGKRKYAFSAQSSIDSNEFTDSDKYKGDIVAPFTLYSSSLDDDPSRGNLSDFQANLDITNLHHDSYGPYNDVPMQGPFTEKYVGGRPYRHVFTNFTRDNDPPDNASERLEGWILSASSEALDLKNFSTSSINKSVYFRDGLAKRPVNIANIQQTTGAATTDDQYIHPSDVTVIGNYSKAYELVMTNDRSENNKFLIKAEGDILTASVDNYYVSGVVDFVLPRRDLTGSNKYIIANRFSAPGDPATMAEGMLDVEAGEYSVYNALPWRNLNVRQPLNELQADHCKQFGYFSDAYNSASYVTAGETYPGTSGSVSAANYDGSASFHKINRNTRKQPKYSNEYTDDDGTVIIASAHDNWFVQHQIPQTDLQYAWITASIVSDYDGAAKFGFEKPDFSNASLASTDLTFASSSDVGTYETGGNRFYGAPPNLADFIPVDFVGLNTNLYEPVSASANILGYPLGTIYKIGVDASPYLGGLTDGGTIKYSSTYKGVPKLLNGLINHRQGPYGWPSWKQVRGEQHPIIRTHREENRISYLESSQLSVEGDTKTINVETITSSIEPMVTSKYKPMRHILSVKKGVTNNLEAKPEITTVEHTYMNNINYFTDHSVDGFNLDNKILDPNVNKHGEEQTLDAINYYLYTEDFNAAPQYNPISELHSYTVRETVFPKEQYTYLSKVRGRANFVCPFWRETHTERLETSVDNEMGYTVATQSMWALDGRLNITTATPQTGGYDGAGELLSNGAVYLDKVGKFNLSALYTMPTSSSGTGPINDVSWDAGVQSGLDPFASSYASYALEMQKLGKDFGIIPEFRISEYIEDYIIKGFDINAKNPNKEGNSNQPFLTLTGSGLDNTDPAFYKTYSNSDFLKYFAIRDVHEDLKAGTVISGVKLRCKAMMKFLPYEGFYPAQRTLQLATLFSSSYLMGGISSGSARAGLTPFYAPGIMYNSIKAGIGVKFPMPTGSYITGSHGLGRYYKNTQTFENIPFEAILSPQDHLVKGVSTWNDLHINIGSFIGNRGLGVALAGSTYDFDIAKTHHVPEYTLAANNFFAESINFFLPGGRMTSIVSLPEGDPAFGQTKQSRFNSGSVPVKYMMSIVLSNFKGAGAFALSSDTAPFTNYKDNTAYGPRGGGLLNAGGSPFHAPPYSYGYVNADGSPSADFECWSRAIITWTPDDPTAAYEYTLDEIMSKATTEYLGLNTFTQGTPNARMQITASININVGNIYTTAFDAITGQATTVTDIAGTTNRLLIIEPKWESPMLNFIDSVQTNVASSGDTERLGMWHQHGEIEETTGVFLQVVDGDGIKKNNSSATGSLADLLGFDRTGGKEPQRLGKIAGDKEISEAVVAIPYRTGGEWENKKAPYKISRDAIWQAEQILNGKPKADYPLPDDSIIDMVRKMKRYVIPPHLDFVTYGQKPGGGEKTDGPFAMYIFEFKHKLTQQDLANIWQNLPPTSMGAAPYYHESDEVTISHSVFNTPTLNLLAGQLYDDAKKIGFEAETKTQKEEVSKKIVEDIRWMVFKVKKRAATNYYDKTTNLNDGGEFEFKFANQDTGFPKITYNWPYDYFSMVELVKLDAEITLKPDDGTTQEKPFDATKDQAAGEPEGEEGGGPPPMIF